MERIQETHVGRWESQTVAGENARNSAAGAHTWKAGARVGKNVGDIARQEKNGDGPAKVLAKPRNSSMLCKHLQASTGGNIGLWYRRYRHALHGRMRRNGETNNTDEKGVHYGRSIVSYH